MDVETNTRWDMLGQAIEGPLKGERLHQVPAYNSMWFAWDTYWHDARVWAGEGISLPKFLETVIEQVEQDVVPEAFELSQNFPNPFNPSTQIQLTLPEAGVVELTVCDNLGQVVRTLLGTWRDAGVHLFSWDDVDDDGRAVASGMYTYTARLQRGEHQDSELSQARRMTLVR